MINASKLELKPYNYIKLRIGVINYNTCLTY